jgi:16S rRNA (cytosine967-C5)-methyltransferase
MRREAGADPTRGVAFELLSAVLDRHRPLEEALDEVPADVAWRDRAAAHRLAATVLRRTGTLDAVLEPFLRKEPPMAARHVLRIGAAGLLLLETPAHAAVATAVGLARGKGLAPFAGLVNAVLRRVAETGPAALEAIDGPRVDTPSWLWASWGAAARAIAIAHQSEAPLDLTLRPGTTAPDGAEVLPTGSMRYPPGTHVSDIGCFAAGDAWVQDAAAALPARLLAARPGERVADLCAAPGGKTAQLAATGARVTAVDRDAKRLGWLRENLARLRLIAEVVQADATAWQPDEPFDAVLLDAPCSATGTIRRHPDVLHLKRPRGVLALAAAQDRLIDAASRLVRPGGRLIYTVCSLQPEECERLVEAAIARLPIGHDRFAAGELTAILEALTPEGFLRTHPGLWAERGGMDGFFAVRLIRK